jgi:biotin transport system substrate-specific component
MQSAISSPSGLAHSSAFSQKTLTGRIILAVAATGLVAVCAHISLPLPFTPVPLTLQTFAVILVGMTLGPIAGFSAMVLYLAQGAMGLPVFTPHGPGGVAQLMGPTAGFLFSYPLAAASAGWVVRALGNRRSRFIRAVVAGCVASIIIFTLGAGWLATLLHLNASATWHLAIAPFLPGEAIKVTAAVGIYSTFERWSRS